MTICIHAVLRWAGGLLSARWRIVGNNNRPFGFRINSSPSSPPCGLGWWWADLGDISSLSGKVKIKSKYSFCFIFLTARFLLVPFWLKPKRHSEDKMLAPTRPHVFRSGHSDFFRMAVGMGMVVWISGSNGYPKTHNKHARAYDHMHTCFPPVGGWVCCYPPGRELLWILKASRMSSRGEQPSSRPCVVTRSGTP